MSIKKTIIASAVLAIATMFSGAAQAYIPNNMKLDAQTSYSFQLPSLIVETPTDVPMPRRLPFFSRANGFSSFQVASEGKASAPLGFQILCLQNPSACVNSTASQIEYSPRTMQIISTTNRAVNGTIVAKNDVGIDQWAINPSQGDCEDYALTKRAELVAAGMPISALRIATALTSSGEGHAVLVVRTNRGDMVLDNRTDSIKPWGKSNLNMLTISGANPSQWFNLV